MLCKETFSERRVRFIVSNAAERSVITNIYVEVILDLSAPQLVKNMPAMWET